MQTVKTTITVGKTLYDQTNRMAKELKMSRSALFTLALREFVERQTNKEMLAQIDAAHEDDLYSPEDTLRIKRRSHHRRLVDGE